MNKEIERKFIAAYIPDKYLSVEHISQGYILISKEKTVRVRITDKNAYITIKGERTNFTCSEFEYNIPVTDAKELMIDLCIKPFISKDRYYIKHSGMEWVLDDFYGENKGLLIAEIELTSEEQTFELPSWISKEVTGDHRYSNSNLTLHPFNRI